MRRSATFWLTLFCISLLFLACTLRSGILVDRSFILRFAILSLVLMIAWMAGAGKRIRIRQNFFEIAFILFYAWNLLSATWAIEPTEAILQSQLVFLSYTTFLVIVALTGEYAGFEKQFIKILLLVLLFSFGLAFHKMSSLSYYDPYKIISVSANNNLYAGFLLLSLPLVISGYVLLIGVWNYISLSTGILTLFFIIILQCRAVYLGTIAGIIILFIVLMIRYREVFSKRNILKGTIALIILVSGVALFTTRLDTTRRQYFLHKIMIWEYFRSYDELQAKNLRKMQQAILEDNTQMPAFDISESYYSNANLRVIFWQKSMGLIAEHPVTGVGAGNWRLAIPSIKDPPNPEHTIGNYTYSEPHNEWIRILSELGIIGLILAILIFFLPPAIVLYRILFSLQKPPAEALVYVSFVAGFYLFAAFDFPLRRIEHTILLWSVFAFVITKVPLKSSGNEFINLSQWKRSFIFLSLLVFCLILAAARFRGEYYTVKMFRNERKNDTAVIRYARQADNLFYHITPNTLPVCWFEGVAHYRLGEYKPAEECFKRALRMTPYEVRVLNDNGTALYKLGRPVGAIETLREALLIDPFFDDARFNLGAIYYLTGQSDSARSQVAKCRESQKKKDFLEEMK